MSNSIIDLFYKYINTTNLNIYGILDCNNILHSLGTDSKIIGRIFEILSQPILEKIAKEKDLTLETPSSQTEYPDFIMIDKKNPPKKVAIDIKTTYITDTNKQIKFTLGSFASYMRNNTKNIKYKYTDYAFHYVIGYIYKRNNAAQESATFQYIDKNNVVCPYKEVKYFMQEKYKIAGDKPGSGNTENIGSISTSNFSTFKDGTGPFACLGKDIYNLYWKYYPKYRAKEKEYTNLEEFIEWILNKAELPPLLYKYNKQLTRKLLENYRDKKINCF